jgi:DNA invertase Pin-like site-specific DNA recombinase
MRAAAVYARRSQEQDESMGDARSVERQVAGAREWISARGWTLAEEHIYKDEGVSGALFATREDFQRMLRDAAAGAFDALVLFDLDRLGRNSRRTMESLHELDDLGVEVWDYSSGQQIDLDTFAGRITVALKAEFAQEYRDTIRKKVRASHMDGARKGKPKANVPFGYRNDPTNKTIVIVDEEVPIVRAIFDRYAAGVGLHAIARWLNATTTRRGRKWNTTTVRRILRNPIYRGELVWGRSTMHYKWPKTKLIARGPKVGLPREKGQIAVPEKDWISAKRPDLKIIDDAVLARADARLRESRELYLKSQQFEAIRRAPHKAHARFLLSGGLLLCPTCGGHFEGRKGGSAWQGRGVYVCSSRKHKPGSCTNRLSLEMDEMDQTVLDQVEGEMLSPRFVDQLLRMVEDTPDDNERLSAERDGLLAQKGNLVRSLAKGVSPEDVAPLLKELNAKIAKLESALNRPKPVNVNKAQLRAALEQRIAEWREVLRGEPHVARLLLRRLIGPITLWTDEPQPAVPEWLEQYVGLPEHLRPRRPIHWSQIPGAIPSPGEDEPRVRWRAETCPEAILEGEVSDPSGTGVYTRVIDEPQDTAPVLRGAAPLVVSGRLRRALRPR